MTDFPGTAMDTASAVLSLSKASWQLSVSLSNLDNDVKTIDNAIDTLSEEVKSLGHKCDLVRVELDGVKDRSEHPTQLRQIDERCWECLAIQVDEVSDTLHRLQALIQAVSESESSDVRQTQSRTRLERSVYQIVSMRSNVRRHIDSLSLITLVINIESVYILLGRADRALVKELDKLQNTTERMQQSSDPRSLSRLPTVDATLLRYAHSVLINGRSLCKISTNAEPTDSHRETATNGTRVTEWMNTLEPVRQQERRPDPSDLSSNVSSIFSANDAHTVVTNATSDHRPIQESDATDAAGNDSEDDLSNDLAKMALETGAQAFEAQEWTEADSLLQEAQSMLQQLPKQRQAQHDTFDLRYKLAVCTYYTREPAVAEEALTSLLKQSASSDEQRVCICNATHLLSLLCVRMGQLDRARSECEKTLLARRRLLGKQSDASYESTALMSHIYVLLNNRPRAKVCIAMIPEERRSAVLKTVEISLGMSMESLTPTIPSRPQSEADVAVRRTQSILSSSSHAMSMDNRCYGPVSTTIPNSPIAEGRRQSIQSRSAYNGDSEDVRSETMMSTSSFEGRSQPSTMATTMTMGYHESPEVLKPTPAVSIGPATPETSTSHRSKTLSRKEILERIGCQPRDNMEEAVCNSDHQAFTALLHKEKGFFRSKLRKRVRPERVTALHFAALFGEIDMARRLISSNFNINEVPFGYSTSLTPLKFAIGARQVDMVEFLVTYGAKPSDPDTWSTLAGQLMNRSWLKKTMSESEKDFVPTQIVSIMKVLLKNGWDINAPIEKSGVTILHQAVTFWTDSYRWDTNLRTVVTTFLCERGADVFRTNTEGKTPYDLAVSTGHQDVLPILDLAVQRGRHGGMSPVELST